MVLSNFFRRTYLTIIQVAINDDEIIEAQWRKGSSSVSFGTISEDVMLIHITKSNL